MERRDPTFTGWAPRSAYADMKPATGAPAPPPVESGPVEPPATVPSGQAFARFLARPGLARLLLANMGLTLVTLGLYRFWARARLRRHIWSRIEVLGDPLEYTGTGGELFRGFLVALLFLVPLFGGFNALLAFEPGPQAQGIATLVFYAVFVLLYWIAVFRSRRYRLSRTAWRGIRLGQSGSQWPFVFASMGWSLLGLVTLSLAVPFSRAWQTRHLMNRTLVGDAPVTCTVRGRALFLPWLLVVAPVLLWVVGAVVMARSSPFAAYALGDPEAMKALVEAELPRLLPWFFLALGLSFACFVAYRVRETRLLAASLGLAGATFTLRFGFWRVFGRLVLLGFLALLVMAAIFGAAIGLGVVAGKSNPMLSLMPLIVLAFLWLAVPVFAWLLLYVPVLRLLIGGLEARTFDGVLSIGQSRQQADKTGEGLADAFDVGFG